MNVWPRSNWHPYSLPSDAGRHLGFPTSSKNWTEMIYSFRMSVFLPFSSFFFFLLRTQCCSMFSFKIEGFYPSIPIQNWKIARSFGTALSSIDFVKKKVLPLSLILNRRESGEEGAYDCSICAFLWCDGLLPNLMFYPVLQFINPMLSPPPYRLFTNWHSPPCSPFYIFIFLSQKKFL